VSILVIAPLPPPITGQSVAVRAFIESFDSVTETIVIDTSKEWALLSRPLRRSAHVCIMLLMIFRHRSAASLIYFNISQSLLGNLKDLLIYLVCWPYLGRMAIHLHGGAGMRVLMSSKHPVLRALNSFFLRRVGAVVILGDRLKDIYSDVVPADRLHTVPNFASDEFFVSKAVIDTKFASTAPLRLLFLSNLLPGKGHIELLAALSQLPADQRHLIHVDFVGGFDSQEDESSFRQQAEKLQGMQVNVHGVLQGEQKRTLLENAHMFCLPTYYPYEGQPISILEAYASGCAVMTTNHSGIFDIFTPAVNGVEVKPRNPQSIVHALQYALANRQDLHRFAITNQRHAQKKYRLQTHLKALKKAVFIMDRC
jgi:glycosyltransferase involved in cell wall biosynthesis